MTRTRQKAARWAVASITTAGLVLAGFVAPAQAAPSATANPDVTGNEWTTPAAVKVGQTPARAVVVPFDTVEQAKAGPTLHQAEATSPNVRNLDGTWKFRYAARPADKPQVAGVTAVPDGYQDIEVPSSWEVAGKYAGALGTDYPIYNNQDYAFQASGDGVPNQGDFEAAQAPTTFNPVGTYMRTLDLSADDLAGNRLILSFLGVESGFYLYVNGAVVGYGEDSFSTSEFDVTDYVHEGENLLTVQVYRWTTGSFLENQDGLNYGGINRDVLLTVQPEVSIYDYDVETAFADHDYSSSELSVDVDVDNTSGEPATRAVAAHLYDADGQEVATATSDPVEIAPGGSGTATLATTVEDPALWSAEIPNLYTLVLALEDEDGATVQTLGKRVGFREIYMANAGTTNSTSNMRVNGQNLELYGVNRGEADPAYGHHVPYETVVKDVQNAKQLNINAIRTSHYPPDPHLIDLADEYGLYIMDEVNVESHNGRDGINNTPFSIDPSLTSRDFPGNDSRYTAAMEQRMTSMVMRDRSAASVVMYSLGNEAGTGPNFDTMIDVIKDLDAEKLIHYQGDNGNPRVDMVGSFYPEYGAANRPTSTKPFVLSEYQHSMGNTGGELDRYVEIIESSYRQQGGFIWDYVDQSAYTLQDGADTSDGVTQDELYLGFDGSWKQASGDGNFLQNGFIYPDRTWKPEAYEVKKQYQDLKFTQSDAQRADHQVTIVNLNRFRNANTYDIVWQLQEDGTTVQSGTLSDDQADLAPPTGDVSAGATKVVTVPYGIDDPKAGAEYQLLVEYRLAADAPYADAGYVQGSAQFAIDARGADRLVDVAALPASTTTDTADAVTVTGTTPAGAPFTVAVDKSTGEMSTYEVDGKELVTKAPVGSFFRAETDQSAAVNGTAWTTRTPEAYQGWIDQGEDLEDVRVSTLQGLGATTKVVVNATLANGSAWTTTYTVYADATVTVGATLVPSASAPDQLGEFGMMMHLPSDLENMEWYGRGPSETYWDRKAGNNVGVWSGTVDEQFFPYMRIQETGNKTDVRWVALTDDDGAGLLASMDYGEGYVGDPLEVSALHYTPKALSSYNSKDLYPYQAERTDDVVLRVLKHQKGVGNITWGSEPPSAVIGKNDTDQLTYDYVLRPLAAGSDPMSASKDIYPAPSFPLLDSVTIDDMPLTGFSPETFEYDYTLPDYYPTSLVPEVAATAPEGTTVSIDQPTAVPGTAVLHVTSGSSTVDYTVRIAAGDTPSPVVSVPDLVDVPATVSASGAYTGASPGVGTLLYAYSGYGRIAENLSTTGAGLQTASGLFDKGFQGNAEQILDLDISDLDARSFSGVGGIDPSKWTGSGATRSSVIFEVWAHKDVSRLTSAYYAPMAPGAAGTGTIVTTGWTKLAASAVMTGKKDHAFTDVPLTYVEDGVTKHYQALRLVMNANGDNGHDQGVWGDPRVTRDLPEDPQLHSVTLDGAPLPGYSADDHDYTVVLGAGAKVPTVGADADQGIFVNVTQASDVPGTAKVRAGTELYTVNFERAQAPDGPQSYLSDLVSVPTSLTGDGEDRSAVLNGNLLYAYSGDGATYLDRVEGSGDDTSVRLRASGEGDDAVVRTYEHGLAGRAQQVLDLDVSHGDALRFTADVGVDWTMQPDGSTSEGDGPAVRFEVWGASDASTLTNGYYAKAAPTPTGGTLPTDGWVRLGSSPVMANADYAGDLEVRQGLYRFDLDLTAEDGSPYEALRLVAIPAGGDASVQSVWGDPQITVAGDAIDEPVDVIRLTSTVDDDSATVGYLLSTEQDGRKIRSIAAVYDADNRMLGSQEVTFATNDGNQDGDLPMTLPEGSAPTSVAYMLVQDGTLTPVAGAWTKGATAAGGFSHTGLREVLPATDPTLDVAFDAETHDVTLTGSGYSPGSVVVVEGTASGVEGLDHVAFVTVDGRGVLEYTYRSGATSADAVAVRVGGQGFDEILARPLVASITLDGDGVTDGAVSLAAGDRLELTADVSPASAVDRSVTWSSSDPAVATVDDGVVVALVEGTTTVTATAVDGSDVTGSVKVTVLAPAWSATTTYAAGERVAVDGVVYVALWTTRGQEPGSTVTGAWAEVGAPVACTAGDRRSWTASAVYVKADVVVHDGTLWTAQWWTRNQEPGDAYGPWTSAGACDASDATADPAWAASTIYTGGEVVTHAGHRWQAQWWNRNQEPRAGAWGAWKDLGAL
ncbi:beta-galactosidase/beta-glucuronidase [Sediminihabitans luteus]|uniref:Beta-galactosidase n=1 Tax=Sediminihabitans luteus TaxID=1138585 RepID=A0A2M9CQG7_9CELL|nr:glycoside hydrolase family 2 TIM barrel-domain containing protein [Sediminihabitans luteus]PJJ74137.1 beta-galactosidase/beta-glucuronidase [Sediminihabitans luteus]GII98990.1 hypothetical protein Slu03_13680 [Sediminihabitans luteus]